MVGFMPFPRELVQIEIVTIPSRIWIHIIDSISYDDLANQPLIKLNKTYTPVYC